MCSDFLYLVYEARAAIVLWGGLTLDTGIGKFKMPSLSTEGGTASIVNCTKVLISQKWNPLYI